MILNIKYRVKCEAFWAEIKRLCRENDNLRTKLHETEEKLEVVTSERDEITEKFNQKRDFP